MNTKERQDLAELDGALIMARGILKRLTGPEPRCPASGSPAAERAERQTPTDFPRQVRRSPAKADADRGAFEEHYERWEVDSEESRSLHQEIRAKGCDDDWLGIVFRLKREAARAAFYAGLALGRQEPQSDVSEDDGGAAD